jgi:hypothetical protein
MLHYPLHKFPQFISSNNFIANSINTLPITAQLAITGIWRTNLSLHFTSHATPCPCDAARPKPASNTQKEARRHVILS